MRIVLVNPRSQRRGGELFSRSLAEQLRRREHDVLEVYLYPPTADDPLPAAPAELCLGGHRGSLERLVGWQPRTADRYLRAIADFAPDVVQVSGGNTIKYAALTQGRLSKRPLLVYRNIGQPDRWVDGWSRRWLYRQVVFPRVTAVATVARAFLPRIRELCPTARVARYIPNGIDLRTLAPTVGRDRLRAALGTPDAAPVALFAGRLGPEKRVDRLLLSFSSVLERLPEATLWIAGDGPLAGELRALADRLGAADRTVFAGARADIGNLIAASDLAALTSDTEGVPASLLEAAALGKPAVATRTGGAAEAVVHGETGLLVDGDDEPALTRALSDLLRDRELRERMGDAAAARFESSGFSMEEVTTAYEDLYSAGLARLNREAVA